MSADYAASWSTSTCATACWSGTRWRIRRHPRLLDHPELAQRLRGLVLIATLAGRIFDGAPQNRLPMLLWETSVTRRMVRTRTGGVLFGAFYCGKRPSPAMISVFRESIVQHLDDHGPLLPIMHAIAREDRYPRLAEIRCRPWS